MADEFADELERRAKQTFLRFLDEIDHMLDTATPADRTKLVTAGLAQVAKMVKDDKADERAIQMRAELDALNAAARAEVAEIQSTAPEYFPDLPPMDAPPE
jgi:hypothetical protein